jgi:hypothetical protein
MVQKFDLGNSVLVTSSYSASNKISLRDLNALASDTSIQHKLVVAAIQLGDRAYDGVSIFKADGDLNRVSYQQ